MPTQIISWESEVIRLLGDIAGGATGSGSGGSSGSTSDATAANQALAIASLQSLDLDNATEAQQIAISNAISSLETAWLAENATEAKQQEIIDLLTEVKTLLEVANGFVAWSAPISGTINDAIATDILIADPNRKAMRICNLASSAERIYINIDDDASTSDALFVLQQDQTLLLEAESSGRVSAIASLGTINYTVRIAS